jgi:hypothetical protein
MGEIADYLIDQMMDDGYFPSPSFMPRGRNRGTKKNRKQPAPDAFDEQTRATEFPGKKTPAHLLRDYPEKTFDMGFFPTIPAKQAVDPAPDVWDINSEEAPF